MAYDVLRLEPPADLTAGVTGRRRHWRTLMYYYFVGTPQIDPDLVVQMCLLMVAGQETEAVAGDSPTEDDLRAMVAIVTRSRHPGLWTPEQASDYCGIRARTLRDLADAEAIRHININGHYYFIKEWVDEFLAQPNRRIVTRRSKTRSRL